MTGLTLYFTGSYMLRMVKVHMVGKVMDLDPLNRLCLGRIPHGTRARCKAGIVVKLLYLSRTINFVAILIIKLGAFFIRIDGLMTVHANIDRRYGSMFTFPGRSMTI